MALPTERESMKLYYMPGASSLFHKADLPHDVSTAGSLMSSSISFRMGICWAKISQSQMCTSSSCRIGRGQ